MTPLDTCNAIVNRVDVEAFVLEILGHEFAELGVVIDDQDRHLNPILPA